MFSLFAFASTALNATVITYSDTFSTTASANNSTYGSYTSATSTVTDAVNLQGFDASLGTLTDVSISFTSSWNFNASVTAQDTYSEYSTYSYACGTGGSWWSGYYTYYCTGYNYYNDTYGSVSSYSDLTVDLIDPSSSTTHLSASLSSSCSVSSSYCSDFDSTGNSIFNQTLDLSGIDINAFVKPAGDTIDLNFINDKSFSLYCDYNDNGDYCVGSSYGSWSGSVSIAYNYVEHNVSEPGVLALLSMGLIGLFFNRKKSTPIIG